MIRWTRDDKIPLVLAICCAAVLALDAAASPSAHANPLGLVLYAGLVFGLFLEGPWAARAEGRLADSSVFWLVWMLIAASGYFLLVPMDYWPPIAVWGALMGRWFAAPLTKR